MKIPRLLLVGCALISWTVLNANAVNVEQGITSGDIQDIVKQVQMETKNEAKPIQPGLVQTVGNCLDRSIQAMKKNTGAGPSQYELGEITVMCTGEQSDAPGACFDKSIQSIKKNTGYGPSSYELGKITAMCAGAQSDAPAACFDKSIQSMKKNTGYGPSSYELGKITAMCTGAQSDAPAACFDKSIQSMKKNTGYGPSSYELGKITAMCAEMKKNTSSGPSGYELKKIAAEGKFNGSNALVATGGFVELGSCSGDTVACVQQFKEKCDAMGGSLSVQEIDGTIYGHCSF